MRIAVAATPAIALPAIKRLHQQHDIAFLITQPDRPAGRGLRNAESPVALWAHEVGVEVFKPVRIAELDELLSTVDLVVTIAYGQLVRSSTLSKPRHGFINLHYSLLPRWRGAAPVQWALLTGDRETGVTVFQLDEGMDTGPIYVQKRTAIERSWEVEKLFDILNELGSMALLEAIDLIDKGREPVPQDGETTHARKIGKSDYVMDLAQPASTLVRQVRALHPRTYFLHQGSKVKVLKAHEGTVNHHEPGTCISNEPLTVATGGNSSLILTSVIPEGRREMSGEEWARGARITSGGRVG